MQPFGINGNMANDMQTEDRRSRWVEEREILAAERRFSALMGTGLGAAGIAVWL
jgi:hypothetical protein